MSIWRWSHWLPEVPAAAQITLGEGDTPLVRSRQIGAAAGMPALYFKLEGGNPSGSFKDRFAVSAVAHMLAATAAERRCLGTSSGNTGAALAAYCAAAGIACEIAVVDGAPREKLQQMRAYGAEIYRVRGFGKDPGVTQRVLDLLEERSRQPGTALQVSAFRYSPLGMQGVQSLSYELAEQAPAGLDHVFCPAGGGGLAMAVARGFRQLAEAGELEQLPAVECVQPEGNDTIAGPLREGAPRGRAVQCTTQISGLQVASVVDGDQTISECRATGGSGHTVSDAEVWQAQSRLAREEGIFTEPAGATALAAALKARAENRIAAAARVVCLVTGSGFKDLPSVRRMLPDDDPPTIDVEEMARRGN